MLETSRTYSHILTIYLACDNLPRKSEMYRVRFISLDVAHHMVIAKRDMYVMLNFSSIITNI